MSTITATGDFPTIHAHTYGSNTLEWPGTTTAANQMLMGNVFQHDFNPACQLINALTTETPNMANQNRRIVQVFIADPNENVPLDKAVLYNGEQKLTDLTDQELYFEVPITSLLTGYNAQRVTWLDKEATKKAGKDVTLDPVKIRDLKMVVVTIAQF